MLTEAWVREMNKREVENAKRSYGQILESDP